MAGAGKDRGDGASGGKAGGKGAGNTAAAGQGAGGSGPVGGRAGLKRIGDMVVKADRPEFRGMIEKVRHLVTVEEVD